MRDEAYAPPPATWSAPQVYFAPPRVPSRWLEYGRPALLFLVTAVTIFLHGSARWGNEGGATLVVSVLAIVVSHEMGHYLACRYYRVDASLPHLLPAPLILYSLTLPPAMINFVGTFGAFIRMRGAIPNRRALFDIGVAGPLAGFVVTVAVAALGVSSWHLVPAEPPYVGAGGLNFSLLFILLTPLLPDHVPHGMQLAFNEPLLLAAWFGTLLTALNLFPVGQLDGGHMTYALLREKAALISKVGFWVCLGLVYYSPSWLFWAILLRLVGRAHPVTLDDEAPVGRGRAAVGILSVGVFGLCFQSSPVDWGTWSELWNEIAAALPSWLT